MAEPRRNAAIYYVPAGFSTGGAQLMGINAASEGLLKAMARHAGVDRLYVHAEFADHAAAFAEVVRGFNPALATEWIPTIETGRLPAVGTVLLPGPGLAEYAWIRRTAGRNAYSLCGVTHTTATPTVLDALVQLLVAPVYPWDAVICTSHGVRAMVAHVLDEQSRYLADRFGGAVPPRPELPVIPLGIDPAATAPDEAARAEWRERLRIGPEDVACLFVGRLSFHAKAHPLPLFQAMEAAARAGGRRLHLLMAGWFTHDDVSHAYRAAAAEFCPSVPVVLIDGREPSVRRWIWSAADLFVSPVDNIQETFGLTPLEAMAAGLPVVVSDWDGYRDTVRDGIDGFRIPTLAPPEGVCDDLAMRYAARLDDYDHYVGHASQSVAVDPAALAATLARLAADPDLRRRMGAEGQARVRQEFDWQHIIPRYQALWGELAARRAAWEGEGRELPVYPARPDPFRAFRTYPTRVADADLVVRRTDLPDDRLAAVIGSPLVSFAQAALPDEGECAAMLARLADGPASIRALLEGVPAERRRAGWRGLVWLAKYGFVTIG